ncbi:hypothetical protein, unlikely [Trypanosoma brucei gambiense DAL972]|uniref:Uncharacterized protein n=1 Tax=Trypanosoma brucei gambiense (strain MHOM/CI/86/DAL972) TaxID=679716 RepID=C9ZN87_TRYB9|nr:hypothetical protein, unlikely [Trypanosoma brucei gambiense DAL972]CBH10865.1 hypothetical protein, unlikely [Trypanosoma brucei gambiense DAL972]|eukprot:XP_011773152.1 hypothetical protein, unlikely [Trypanosoma brucei gambiense DAL972]
MGNPIHIRCGASCGKRGLVPHGRVCGPPLPARFFSGSGNMTSPRRSSLLVRRLYLTLAVHSLFNGSDYAVTVLRITCALHVCNLRDLHTFKQAVGGQVRIRFF